MYFLISLLKAFANISLYTVIIYHASMKNIHNCKYFIK